MKKIIRTIAVATGAALITVSLAPFSACSEKRAVAALSAIRAEGIIFSAVHDWDFVSATGDSVVSDRTSDLATYAIGFDGEEFCLDGYRLTKGSSAATQEGKTYEGNYVFQRGDKKYLTDTLLVDEIGREWTKEDVLFDIPLLGQDSVAVWFNGVSAFSVVKDYASPSQFLTVAAARLRSLAKAVEDASLGEYRQTDEGYYYETDLLALYSPLADDLDAFVASLSVDTTVGEMLTSDVFTELFDVRYGGFSGKEFAEECKRLLLLKPSPVYGAWKPTMEFSALLEHIPSPRLWESRESYLSRLLKMPLKKGINLGQGKLSDLFEDEEFLFTETLREKVAKDFTDVYRAKIKTRYTGFDEAYIRLQYDGKGTFCGLDWYKRKSTDFAGLYTTTNEYALTIRFQKEIPDMADISTCRIRKIDDVVGEKIEN